MNTMQTSTEIASRLVGAVTGRLFALPEHVRAGLEDVYPRGSRGDRDALVILDDLFPWLGTGFRVKEFNEYLQTFETSIVYSTNRRFCREMASYRQYFPEYADRIFRLHAKRGFDGRLAYIVFLHNAITFLPVIERLELPFVLELYPGGHFHLDDRDSDEKLRRVCNSPFLKKIIVTQRVTREYLLGRGLCAERVIHYIHGGVVSIPEMPLDKKFFGTDKQTFDICFTAYRQMPLGEDKGYDLFVEVAKKLGAVDSRFRFHVVGGFDKTVIDCSCLGERIRFYGPQTTNFFPNYYRDKDVILSPNRPFVLAPGAFDGIPTGAVVEAGSCSVAMFCTDQLQLTKETFEPGRDIVIVKPDVDSICQTLLSYFRNPVTLYNIARYGRKAIEKTYSPRIQLGMRTELLREIMKTIPIRQGR